MTSEVKNRLSLSFIQTLELINQGICFITEKGFFNIAIGNSSKDFRLLDHFDLSE